MMNTRLDSSVRIKTRIRIEVNKTEYVPMHTIRVITRLALNAGRTDRASASSPASIVTRRVITLIMRLNT